MDPKIDLLLQRTAKIIKKSKEIQVIAPVFLPVIPKIISEEFILELIIEKIVIIKKVNEIIKTRRLVRKNRSWRRIKMIPIAVAPKVKTDANLKIFIGSKEKNGVTPSVVSVSAQIKTNSPKRFWFSFII